MRKHPDPERIREVMNGVMAARSDANLDYADSVCMASTSKSSCNTPGCHAGELFIGMTYIGKIKHPLSHPYNYDYGSMADMFAEYIFHTTEDDKAPIGESILTELGGY